MPYALQFSVLANHLETIVSHGGYLILSIFTILEGIPVIGMAVPGHMAIIFAGFLSRIGTLNLSAVLVITILGAAIGDYIGFWLGRRYGLSFIDRIRPYFFVTDTHIEKANALLAKHTGKSMIIGRFTPATRALMPFLVGASGISYKKFWLFNIIGATSWAVISVMVGYLFGASYHAAAGVIGKFVVFAIIAALIIAWGYRFVNMRFHIFRRYELFTLALNIIALGFLALTAQDASSAHPFMANLDVAVSNFADMHNHGSAMSSFAASIASAVSTIGGTAVLGALGGLLAIWLALRKKWRSAGIFIISIAGTAIAKGLIKELFMRERPLNALQTIINDPSFPSGHASMAAAFFAVFAYLFAAKIHSRNNRELLIAVSVIAVVLIGISRIVLNVHWLSDVIAGWALGLFIATASILIVRYLGVLILPRAKK